MFSSGVPVAFSRHVGFSLVGRKGGFADAVQAVVRQRKASEFCDAPAMRQQQLTKLKKLLVHAQQTCPYWGEQFAQVGFDPQAVKSIADLAALPPLPKQALIDHREAMRSSRYAVDELNLNSTGGSTGLTVNFYQDRNWLIHQVAGGQFYDSLALWSRGCRTAYLWGAPTDNALARANWRENMKAVLTNSRVYDSFDMSDDRMAAYHQDLRRFRPHVMVCYAGSAHRYARYVIDNGVHTSYPLRSVITSAETLTQTMRSDIEQAFRVPVFNRYGSREVGVVAAECERHEGLHVNEVDMIVECDRTSEEGGELLVTNLNNFGMPLIRYRIGDVGALTDAPCACGRAGHRITRLLGRSSDFFSTASGRKVHGEYFTHLFYGIDGVASFQLVQETIESFSLKIVRNRAHWNDLVEPGLRSELQKVFGESMALQVEYVESIPPSASGKYRFTISKV
jgi:phenylacetate-CoA ligase